MFKCLEIISGLERTMTNKGDLLGQNMVRMKSFVGKAFQKQWQGMGSRKNYGHFLETGGIGRVIEHWRQNRVEAIETFVSRKGKETESTFRNTVEKNWTASGAKMISFVQQEIRNSETLVLVKLMLIARAA